MPLLKLIVACFVVGLGISLLYVCIGFLKWVWSQLTLNVIAFVFLVLVALSLQLFRP